MIISLNITQNTNIKEIFNIFYKLSELKKNKTVKIKIKKGIYLEKFKFCKKNCIFFLFFIINVL